jgi:hypothetical protein
MFDVLTGKCIQTTTIVRRKLAAKGDDIADLKNNSGLMAKA